MTSALPSATGGPTGTQRYVPFKPRGYNPNGASRWIIWVHYASATAYTPWTAVGEGSLKLLSGIADEIPVLTIDGGTIPGSGTDNGQFTAGNATVVSRIADAVAWVVDPAKGGGKTDKVILGASSQGAPGIINYAKANPTKVAALWAVLPLSDLDNCRNANRPNGWTGTTPNAPNNTDAINAALGLAAGSTGDYPTHGTSLVTLPAGSNPATADLSAITGASIPCKAWASPTDPTAPLATVTALWATKLGGTVASISPDLGHTDASLGSVPSSEVLAFLRPVAA